MMWRSVLLAGASVALLAVPFLPQARSQQSGAALSVRHIHIRVMDVERTKAFYRDKLGLKVSNERPGEVVEFEGGALWFGKWRGTGAIPTGGITIGLHAASVEATYNLLKQRGVALPNPPAAIRDEWAFGLKDPDGYAIEIEGPK
jgi:catechol 2,3-dioxygenase-like lactoylglutathione lyase family enzyme